MSDAGNVGTYNWTDGTPFSDSSYEDFTGPAPYNCCGTDGWAALNWGFVAGTTAQQGTWDALPFDTGFQVNDSTGGPYY